MPDRTKTSRSYEWSDRHLSDFLDTTTINGVFHVFRARSSIRRIIWGILLIAAIITCIILCGFSVANFVRRPTATTTTLSVVQEPTLPFPAVTICNLNTDSETQSYELVNALFNPDVNFVLHSQNGSISGLVSDCQRTVANMTELEKETDIWEAVSAINNLVHYCGFSPGPDQEIISCKNSFQPVLTSAGVCFTFNGIGSQLGKFVTATGVRYGLKLILNVDQAEYPSYSGLAGVKVVVHDRNYIGQPNLHGISVSPGQNVDIGVDRHMDIDRIEPNCINGRFLEFFPNYRYSQVACRENTLLNHVAANNTCGCVLSGERPSFGPYVSTPNCTFRNICCLVREFATYDEYDACPLSCVREEFEYENSYSSFPNGRTLAQFASSLNVSTDFVRNSFLSVRVFINDPHVTTSTSDFTYGSVDLLSNIGGLMGLFLGISIISIFEVLILILDELKKVLYTKKCQQKIRKFDENIHLPDIRSGTFKKPSENQPPEPTTEETSI